MPAVLRKSTGQSWCTVVYIWFYSEHIIVWKNALVGSVLLQLVGMNQLGSMDVALHCL